MWLAHGGYPFGCLRETPNGRARRGDTDQNRDRQGGAYTHYGWRLLARGCFVDSALPAFAQSRRERFSPAVSTASVMHLFALLFCLLGVQGCRENADAPAAVEHSARPLIAVVGAGQDDPLWPVLAGTAEAMRSELGTMELRVDAPDIVSPNAQADLIRHLHAEGAQALCVQVIDPLASRDLLERLRGRGVVVVTMVRPVESETPFDHCGWDEREVAERMAEELATRLPEGGHLALLVEPDSSSAESAPRSSSRPVSLSQERYRMLKYALSEYSRLEVLQEYPCDSAASALEAMKQGLDEFPTLAGWVSLGNWPLRIEQDALRPLLAGEAARFLLAADPFLSRCAAFGGDLRIVAVGADYGSIAPQAIGIARAILLKGGSFRGKGRVPLKVVTNAGFEAFQRDWAAWCTGAKEEP
jgi:ABC-type sugar transport system substrate-binding protein